MPDAMTPDALFDKVTALIRRLRRGEDIAANWPAFQTLIETECETIATTFDTRWLISVCDTYGDFGDPLIRANALMISTIVNMEKIAQTFVRWRLGYPAELAPAIPLPHRKVKAWDGMSTMNLDVGDVSNHLFGRLFAQLQSTPILLRLFETIVRRLAEGDTILAALDRTHGHVFDRDYAWIMGDDYREARESGRVPLHKYAMYLTRD